MLITGSFNLFSNELKLWFLGGYFNQLFEAYQQRPQKKKLSEFNNGRKLTKNSMEDIKSNCCLAKKRKQLKLSGNL